MMHMGKVLMSVDQPPQKKVFSGEGGCLCVETTQAGRIRGSSSTGHACCCSQQHPSIL